MKGAKQNKLHSRVTIVDERQYTAFVNGIRPELRILTEQRPKQFPHCFYVFVTLATDDEKLFKAYDATKDTVEDFLGEIGAAAAMMKQDKPGYLYLRVDSFPSQAQVLIDALAKEYGSKVMVSPSTEPAGDKVKWYFCLVTEKSQSLIKG